VNHFKLLKLISFVGRGVVHKTVNNRRYGFPVHLASEINDKEKMQYRKAEKLELI
jgi:hypothetical protein